jgi:hypothetical protein
MSEDSDDETYTDNFTDIVGLDFISVSGRDDDDMTSCADFETLPDYLAIAYLQVKEANKILIEDIEHQFRRYKFMSKDEAEKKFKFPCKYRDFNGKPCKSFTNNESHYCAVHEDRAYSVCKLQCIYDSNDLEVPMSHIGRCEGRTLSSYGLCKNHANCAYYRERQLYDRNWVKFIMSKQPLYILNHYCSIVFDDTKKEYVRIDKFKNLQDAAIEIRSEMGLCDDLPCV